MIVLKAGLLLVELVWGSLHQRSPSAFSIFLHLFALPLSFVSRRNAVDFGIVPAGRVAIVRPERLQRRVCRRALFLRLLVLPASVRLASLHHATSFLLRLLFIHEELQSEGATAGSSQSSVHFLLANPWCSEMLKLADVGHDHRLRTCRRHGAAPIAFEMREAGTLPSGAQSGVKYVGAPAARYLKPRVRRLLPPCVTG